MFDYVFAFCMQLCRQNKSHEFSVCCFFHLLNSGVLALLNFNAPLIYLFLFLPIEPRFELFLTAPRICINTITLFTKYVYGCHVCLANLRNNLSVWLGLEAFATVPMLLRFNPRRVTSHLFFKREQINKYVRCIKRSLNGHTVCLRRGSRARSDRTITLINL